MQNLKIKITGYEEASGSLTVSFASDSTASSDPSDYQSVAFQPAEMWPDIQDIEQIKLQIAKAGLQIVKQAILKEAFLADQTQVSQFQALVGNVFDYAVSDLVEPVPEATPMLVV